MATLKKPNPIIIVANIVKTKYNRSICTTKPDCPKMEYLTILRKYVIGKAFEIACPQDGRICGMKVTPPNK
jgi:hypothetical protein